MTKILVSDAVHEDGIDFLKAQPDIEVDVKLGLPHSELVNIIDQYDALIVRSETKVSADVLEAAKKLRVVGRAGIGVDNVDLDIATRKGIAVVNAPTGNIMAAAEHTIALILSLARNIPQADFAIKSGEWRRGDFIGSEVRGKSLGIIGFGRVGTEVAKRAIGLEMKILAYDPFILGDQVKRLDVQLVSFSELLKNSDFVSIHTPLTDSTNHIIGKNELKSIKPGARIINTARGNLIDEESLQDAITNGVVAGAALDVFSKEPPELSPLIKSQKVITTPHLGASTVEAQIDVSVEVAEQVLTVINGQPAKFTVNAPSLKALDAQSEIAPYIEVTGLISKLGTQMSEGQVTSINLKYEGDIAKYDTSILKASALVGLLQPVSDSQRVNLVNATLIAEDRGLKVSEEKSELTEQYASLVTLEVTTTEGVVLFSGTHVRGEAHVVRVGEYWIDLVPNSPYMLFIDHQDRPGLIGAVGTITGGKDINISFMEVGRLAPRGLATMIFGLDDPMPDSALKEILSIPYVSSAKVIKI